LPAASFSSDIPRGLPPTRPRFRAACKPASVLSLTRFFSNSGQRAEPLIDKVVGQWVEAGSEA
jgi:hypothetical protein